MGLEMTFSASSPLSNKNPFPLLLSFNVGFEFTTSNLSMPSMLPVSHLPHFKAGSRNPRRQRGFEHGTILSNSRTNPPASSVGTTQVVEEAEAEVEVTKGCTVTQFCDKMIDVFMNEKPRPKDWRKLLVFREEWNKYKENFYNRCQARADTENDPSMKQKLISLARKVKKIDDEMERHTELLKEVQQSPTDINAVVARRRKDFTGDFFRHLTLISETYDSLDDRDGMARLGAKCLSAVSASDNTVENMEWLDAAQAKFDDILNSPSLDMACDKIKSMAKAKELDSSLILLINSAWASAKESSTMKNESPNISYQRSCRSTQLDTKLDPRSLDFQEALSMLHEGIEIESSFYVPLLQECINNNSVSESQVIHTHIIKTGMHEDLFLMTFLLNVYAKCGALEDARKVFDQLPQRNVVSWTALMTGYIHNSQPELAIQVFQELLECGAYPTNYTVGAVLSACSSLQAIELGKQIHAYIIKYQVESDTSAGNSLCSLYSKCGNLESSIKAFRRIQEKNVISWTTVISACGDNGEAMMGLRLFAEMLLETASPNEFTMTSVLSLCCTLQALDVGEQVHSFSIKLGYESNLRIKNSIMYLYLKCGWIDEARKLFNGMEAVSLITWNAMIAGHAQMMDLEKDDLSVHRSGIEALNIFLKLNRSNMKPDLFTFSSILTVCSSLAALEQGEQIHAQAIKTGFLSDIVVGSALVNMYNKCGNIERASKAFVEMSSRTLISWTSMITGFAQHGHSRQALQLFEDMVLAGVRPNKITFVGVLSACSYAGLVDQALSYFDMMTNEYQIKPVMDHYACLIDMFVRLGQLDEAFEFIKKMNVEPNEFIWSILIAGCRSQGKMELGFYAAERLLELKPKDAETYFFLLNMYLSAGRWKDVSRVRKLMRDEKFGRLKDWSWISIKDKVFSFNSDDNSHSQNIEMYKLLENLLDKAKTLGYVSQRRLEIAEEDEKISSTSHHSERLAIAFWLLNTPNGATIRVIKSISMCRDCHSFIKFISVLTGREIIIRDSKRLHKFTNGHCSCGDFGCLL